MTDQVSQIMQKTAEYIGTVQDANDRLNAKVAQLSKELAASNEKTASFQNTFIRRATQTAGVLADRGVIDKSDTNAFIDKIAEAPESVWDFIEKLAASVEADALGGKSRDSVAKASSGDPWYDIFFSRKSV